MIIGIPSSFSFQSSNVKDYSVDLEELLGNAQAPVFDPGLELKCGEWTYKDSNRMSWTPKLWNTEDEGLGIYNLDEVIFKDFKLMKITGKKGVGLTYHQRPKEPEEYSGWDEDMDYENWSHRWVRISSDTEAGWLEKTGINGDRQYAMVWDNDYRWSMRDMRETTNQTILYNTLKRSQKFDSSTDIKARIISWGASGLPVENTIQIESMVERYGYFYLRTNIDAPLEYADWIDGIDFQYSYMEVTSPADIDGFSQLLMGNALSPFDGKNYTQTVFDTTSTDGVAQWTLLTTKEIDSIAFGRLICDSLNIRITDQTGENVLFQINNYVVDNTISISSPEEFPTTVVIYTGQTTIPAGSVVIIELNGAVITVGEMLPASKLEAGFTKMAFKNKFKDFSPKEQDQWGNWYYTDGVRVHTHSGTVELPVVSYDQMTRLMMRVGGQPVVINSSDSINNEVPDSYNIFSATMMIARFITFELSTKEKNKRIGDIAQYTFSLEELV